MREKEGTLLERKAPVVIVAIDAADPRLLQRWAQDGYLPTIASLMERGWWGKTMNPDSLSVHGASLSLFSGASCGQHGFYYFRELQPGTYNLHAASPYDTQTLPFWTHLRGTGQKVAIIDAPESGIVPGLNGFQLTHWVAQEVATAAPTSFADPPELLQEAYRLFGPRIRVSEFEPNSSAAADRVAYQQLRKHVERKGRLCRAVLSRDQFDLIVVGFSEAHTAGHRFWKYRTKAVGAQTPPSDGELTHAVRAVYQAIDRQLALLLEQVSGDANVMIVSADGMEDLYPTAELIEAFCLQLGYTVAPTPGPRSWHPFSVARRFLPESWRIAVNQHLPFSFQERLFAEHFRKRTDWARTTAFAIPSFYTSFLRVNLKGREPQGIVHPGDDYKKLLDRLTEDLQLLTDPQTGKPVVKRTVCTSEVFQCDPPLKLPDLFVEWQPSSHFFKQVVHPRAELVQREPRYLRDTHHSLAGFVCAAGPAMRECGNIGEVLLLDITPTCLALLGQSVPNSLTGKVLRSLVDC